MQSTVKINDLVQMAKQHQMPAVALTDHNVLHGAVAFYQACVKEGIRPIIGMETSVYINDQSEDIILLAKNTEGYQSLVQISSIIQANVEKSIDYQQCLTLLKDCLIIIPFQQSILKHYLNTSNQEGVRQFLNIWPEGTSIGLTRFDLDQVDQLQQFQVPLVAIGDVSYLRSEDQQAYHCLRAIDKKSGLDQFEIANNNHFFNQTEAYHFFEDYPELIDQANKMATACKVELTFNQHMLPRYPLEDDQDASTYLRALCEQAADQKYSDMSQVKDRLAYELSVIQEMGFSDYFLIVWDFIRFAKSQDILVGPGRGSVAGSIVAYLLGITTVDPLKYNLLFERFLNPERVSMPDIDVDFSDHRRQEVIDYVKAKYGYESVAQIGTFGTFKARSIIRELAKVFKLKDADLQFILKEIPAQGDASLVEVVKSSHRLFDFIKENEELQRFFKVARILEGLPRNMSTHAAGVIIHDQPLLNTIPLIHDQSGNLLTQFPMGDLEAIGLLKMDFLGLRNLTTIERIINLISRYQKEPIKISEIPFDDQRTFDLLKKGETNGVFQLESAGMQRVLKALKPTNFEEVVAVNALYRPGPMDFIDTYIKRKHQQEKVSYIHPDLKPILDATYGVLIYQEQIIQLAHQFAGLSFGEADILRRAISKKKQADIESVKQQFIAGCLNKGYAQHVAEEIFSWIYRFANYGFNRSHAVAYSIITYQLAYLKAHFPVCFFTELLNTITGQQEKVQQFIREAKKASLSLLPPSINKSYYYYRPDRDSIRMGLSSIKGLSYPVISEILKVRQAGSFKDLFDFCMRISLEMVNRSAIETLILAGVFDEWNIDRATLLATVDRAMEQGELFGDFGDQTDLFVDGLQLEGQYQQVEPFSVMQKLAYEKELLGMFVTDHPLALKRRVLRRHGLMDITYIYSKQDQKIPAFVAIIQSIRIIRTKRGESMAFLQLADEKEEIEAVIFPDLYRDIKPSLEEQMIVAVKGKKDWRHGKVQVIIQNLEQLALEELPSEPTLDKQLFIKVNQEYELEAYLPLINDVSQQYPGQIPIIIYQSNHKKTFRLSEDYFIDPQYPAIKQLEAHFGQGNVVLKA